MSGHVYIKIRIRKMTTIAVIVIFNKSCPDIFVILLPFTIVNSIEKRCMHFKIQDRILFIYIVIALVIAYDVIAIFCKVFPYIFSVIGIKQNIIIRQQLSLSASETSPFCRAVPDLFHEPFLHQALCSLLHSRKDI